MALEIIAISKISYKLHGKEEADLTIKVRGRLAEEIKLLFTPWLHARERLLNSH